jgi:hypothetical protein
MSHNTTIRINTSMADLQSEMVQEMMKECGWKLLKGGIYRGYEGTKQEASLRIAIPAQQAGPYGEELSSKEAKEYGLTGRYIVIGVNEEEVKVPQVDKAGHPIKGPDGRPATRTEKQISVMLDDIGAEKVTSKIKSIIDGGKFVSKVQRQVQTLRARGNQVQVNPQQIKQQIAAAIVSGQQVKIRNNF